jgi:hypothetical protein
MLSYIFAFTTLCNEIYTFTFSLIPVFIIAVIRPKHLFR